MPARTPQAKCKKILELRAIKGMLLKDIARKLHLHRTTVGRILQEYDADEIDLAAHPAAAFTAGEVTDIQLLCTNFCEAPCSACGARILYFRWSLGARCPECKKDLLLSSKLKRVYALLEAK